MSHQLTTQNGMNTESHFVNSSQQVSQTEIPKVRDTKPTDVNYSSPLMSAISHKPVIKSNPKARHNFKPKKTETLKQLVLAQNKVITKKVKNRANFIVARSNPRLLELELARGKRDESPSLKGKFGGSGRFALWDFGTAYKIASKLVDYEKIGGA